MGEHDMGLQPLDSVIEAWGLSNHDLVAASTEQLNHKQVQKARKGRRLTLHLMQKVARALNVAIWRRLESDEREQFHEYGTRHLFSYAKGHEAVWQDFNAPLCGAVRGRDARDQGGPVR